MIIHPPPTFITWEWIAQTIQERIEQAPAGSIIIMDESLAKGLDAFWPILVNLAEASKIRLIIGKMT